MSETKKSGKSYEGFTAEEISAMKEHAKELKSRQTGGEAMAGRSPRCHRPTASSRALSSAIVTENAPQLLPKTWYGQPAFANAEGKVIVFFQAAAKFKTRYATLGFSEDATSRRRQHVGDVVRPARADRRRRGRDRGSREEGCELRISPSGSIR